MVRPSLSFSIVSLHAGALLAVFLLAGVVAVITVNQAMRQVALREARAKARILLDYNLATHTYLNQELKPAVFALTEHDRSPAYFDATWMSSTYAVRGINRFNNAIQSEPYAYKECAINARSPENEADAQERAFISDLNRTPALVERAGERIIDGRHYYVVMRRGETLTAACVRCHSVPSSAPAEMVSQYGTVRSFSRRLGDVVSAVSIRIPLDQAYRSSARVTAIISSVLVALLLGIYLVQNWLSRRLIFVPLNRLRDKAAQISSDERKLGEMIAAPHGRELQGVTEAFNRLSTNLRQGREHLEEQVAARTRELQLALDKVKTLRGMIPICAACKKIRDDAGFWSQVEVYLKDHSEAEFTHGLCPECLARLYPDYPTPTGNDR